MRQAVCKVQGRLKGVCKAPLGLGPGNHPVHNHFQGVLFLLVDRRDVAQLVELAVQAHPHVSLAPDLFQELFELSFPPPDHGSQHQEPGAFRQREDLVHHLLHCLLGDRPAALVAVDMSHSCIEKAEVVVDFRHCPHSGPRIVGGGLLVYGDGRRKSLDEIHIWLLHLAKKLSGV